jgi:hypothetical protein
VFQEEAIAAESFAKTNLDEHGQKSEQGPQRADDETDDTRQVLGVCKMEACFQIVDLVLDRSLAVVGVLYMLTL